MSNLIETSVGDLSSCGWNELVSSSKSHDCISYSEIFFAAGTNEDDSQRAAALILLGHSTTMMLKSGAEHANQPFAARSVTSDGRSAIPSDFTQAELNALSELAPEITNPELQARISDLVWITTKHYPAAQIAMPAYLRAAKALVHEGKWSGAINRLERSLRLAAMLGKRESSDYSESIDYVNHLLSRSDLLDDKHFGAFERLMKLLQEFGEGDAHAYSLQTSNFALAAEQSQDWLQARGYWMLNALWCDRLGDEGGTKSARLRAARTFEQEADRALGGASPNHGTAVAYLDDALQDMRRLGELAEAERLHAKLLKQQALLSSQLVHFSSEVPDMTDQIKAARDAIKGRTLSNAIIELASMVATMTEAQAISEANEIAQQTPFLHSISSSAMNEYGRTVAQRPSRYSVSADEAAAAIYADAVNHAAKYFGLHNSVIVESARQQLLREHHLALEDLSFIVKDNPFINRSRTMLIARGLQAGLLGDFSIALHLLLPQLEHSLRHTLAQAGVITSGFDDPTGIQDEHNINSLLYREELKSIFGDNLTFSMKVALVEQWGYNLRNRMAHGLLDESDCFSAAARYAWGLTLRFYCLPALIARRDSSNVTTEPSEDSS